MADKRYSIDDILNEYPKVGDSADKPVGNSKIDVDELLMRFDKKDYAADNAENIGVTMHNTDIFDKPCTPDLSDIKIELTADFPPVSPVAAAAVKTPPVQHKSEDVDNLEMKYASLSEKMNVVREQDADKSYNPPPKPDRSYSEKLEQRIEKGVVYKSDEPDDERSEKLKKAGLLSIFAKKADEEADLEKGEMAARKAEQPLPKKPAYDDPFEKYASIAQDSTEAHESTPKPAYEPAHEPVLHEPARKNLDDILEEYARHDEKKQTISEHTQHKGITELFTRLIPKSEVSEEEKNLTVSGNTELLDGMMRLKKERRTKTTVSPIERKSISDIDLNLDDKILPNTEQIAIDPQQSELDKLTELKERRSKKIKDFVLVGDEEDLDDEEVDSEDAPSKTIEDFEAFEDAPSVSADISQLRNSLVMRMLVLVICLAASLYISLANDTNAFPLMDLLNKSTQPNTYLFVNAIIGLLAAFTSYTVISCGLSKLFSLKADCDSLCAVSVVTSIGAAMIMFANPELVRAGMVHIYITAAICSLMFNTAGKLLIVARTQRSFRFVSGSTEKYALFSVADREQAETFTRGAFSDFPALSAMRKTEFLSEFLKLSYSSDSTDKFCRIFTPVVIIASTIVALTAGISYGRSSGVYVGISTFVGCISICSTFSMMLVVNLPMARASKKHADVQGAVLGYECVEEFSETNSVLIDASELFPQGSVNLSAIKIFSDTRIDEAIVEAASLTNQAGSILKNMFYDIIAGKTELLNPVESYIFEDSMGLCGWINNKRVLLGNRELMINHSIEGIPSAAKEKEYTEKGKSAVYLSISGELSAMFIIELTPSIEVKQALNALRKNGVYVIIRSVDSLITIHHLSDMFDVSPEYFKLIPFRVHPEFDELTSYQPKQRATLACSGRFCAFVSLLMSCKHMRGTISVGIAMQAVSIFLGILICFAMVLLKSLGDMTVTLAITYNLIFAAVLVVFQSLRKN